MMHVKTEQLAQSAVRIGTIRLDAGARPDTSIIAKVVAALLRALHESRRRQGERELARYRHLMPDGDATHPDLEILRRPCRTDKSSG
jgi:hypothetical protein